jgi:hypothetical protein
MTWHQYYGKANKTYASWPIRIVLQQGVISVMNVEMLWNRPQYPMITGTSGMWTACWTLTPWADVCENGWKAIFLSPIPLNSEQFHSHHLLWFKIIIPVFQICIDQGPNTWGRRVTWHNVWHSAQRPLQGGWIWCRVCSVKNTKG